jgi:hypothetical protein
MVPGPPIDTQLQELVLVLYRSAPEVQVGITTAVGTALDPDAFIIKLLADWVESWVSGKDPDRSGNAGCDWCGTPEVSMYEIQFWEVEVIDWTPPRVEAEGFGSLAAGRVPLEMLAAFVVSVEQLATALLRSAQAG